MPSPGSLRSMCSTFRRSSIRASCLRPARTNWRYRPRVISPNGVRSRSRPTRNLRVAVLLKEDPAALRPGHVWNEPVTGMSFVWVPDGCYEMGTAAWSEETRLDEVPAHRVCLDGFWMARYEISEEIWNRILGLAPDALDKGCEFSENRSLLGGGQAVYPEAESGWSGSIHVSGCRQRPNGSMPAARPGKPIHPMPAAS